VGKKRKFYTMWKIYKLILYHVDITVYYRYAFTLMPEIGTIKNQNLTTIQKSVWNFLGSFPVLKVFPPTSQGVLVKF